MSHRHNWIYYDAREAIRIDQAIRWCACGVLQTKAPKKPWETSPFPASEAVIQLVR